MEPLYHFTHLEGLLGILKSDSMLLCKLHSVCDIQKVCFTTRDNIWQHGEWRIKFKDSIHQATHIEEFDYDESFGQYAQEEEWFSREPVYGIVKHIAAISNMTEGAYIDIDGVFDKEKEPLYHLACIVMDKGIGGEFTEMYRNIFMFCNSNDGYDFGGKCLVYIDNEETSLLPQV